MQYTVVLYFSFGAVVATEDETPDGYPVLFDSIEEAEKYGRSKNIPYEVFEYEEKEAGGSSYPRNNNKGPFAPF